MPPKRKNKGPTTPRPANRHSAGPKRTAAATEGAKKMHVSRLAPSVPFQMTTRHGAKTTSSHTSPAASSSASSGSRRSSLHHVAQYGHPPSDLEDEPPAKRSRTLTDSGSPQRSNGSVHNNNINNRISPMNGTQTPEPHESAAGATLAAPKSAAKRRRASDDSTQSSKTMGARPNGLLTRTQSDVSEQQPRKKKRKTTDTSAADSADHPPELTDASTAPNSPEQMPEVDGSQSLQNVLPTNGDAPAKSGRRLPGRRRQPHSDINIETDLRRQLNLKMGYRSLAKVQKALLEELSSRAIHNLEKDPDYHARCPEYGPLMALLDQRRDGRLDQIHAMRTYRLEQLERVRVAEERIQKEQYINRFQELQDDFLLQCYFRMKRIEREMRYQEVDATDDEDNVLPPTYTDEPHHAVDDRLGSKFASRSRAYVEADKELERESVRRRLDQARTNFVKENVDADDSIEDSPTGFARFTGPDRVEAVAHYNLASLADAALEVQRPPSPQVEAPKIQILPNEHASSLMLLAELSAQQLMTNDQQPSRPKDQQTQQAPYTTLEPSQQHATPEIGPEITRKASPVPVSREQPFLLSQAAHSSTVKAVEPAVLHSQETPHVDPKGLGESQDAGIPKQPTPARLSTHRIMDILNDDREVPVSRIRESQPPAPESGTPSWRETVSQHDMQSHSTPVSLENPASLEEPPVDQALMDALEAPATLPSNPPSSPPSNPQSWSRPSVVSSKEPEESLRRRDPLQKIRELLDRKARELGREPPDRSQYWRGPSAFKSMSAQSSHERPEVAGYDPQRPSTGLYDASPSAAPGYSSTSRRESKDVSTPHWERDDRRMSGSQAPHQPAASPYQTSALPSYHGEHQRPGPTPPSHQGPFTSSAGSLPLPPKPPGPPPSGPINFRFAHYDPAPPRQPHPPPSPSYPPASTSVPVTPQPQYTPAYSGPPVYPGGYVPPPGSFQAPPPPSSMPAYPPLKIHQYGGQPILPANMAPPPQAGPPMTFFSQSARPSIFSPPQGQPPPHYEQREGPAERPPEPQSRPRRQYRSYHAPGTQFRTYQGPGERRRGG